MTHHARQQADCKIAPPRYRITAGGRAVAAWEQQRARTRHLLDLLDLLQTSGHGVAETQLRQFMPAESLMRAISCLMALGLIECEAAADVFRRS